MMRIGLATLSLFLSLLGQQAPQSRLPEPDSTSLYLSFLRFHDNFSAVIAQRKAAMPAKAGEIDLGAARYLNLQPDEQAKAAAVTRRAAVELQKIDDQEIALRNRLFAFEQRPSAAAKRQFQQQREAVALRAIQEMRQELGAAWPRLQSHINNTHRTSIRTWAAEGVK
jgi:hypothetical protein